MPRFYFDLFLGSDFSCDEIGSDFGSLRAAEVEVMRPAAELTRDRLLKMQSATSGDIRIEVRDEDRQLFLTVTVLVQAERAGLMPSDMQ